MAISSQEFPPRKRRPSAGSFISPNFSDSKLIQSLLVLSLEVAELKPLDFILRRCSASVIRKSSLLAVLLEEILRNPICFLPRSSVLCFEEIYLVLQRIKTLLEDCLVGSKIWLLMQNETVSNSFHEMIVELSTLLDIFPVKEFDLTEDVKDLVVLIRKQCWERKAFVDHSDRNLKLEVLKLLHHIKNEIVPDQSKLKVVFDALGLRDSTSCIVEIESLEDEVQSQVSENSKAETVALIGLVRFAKCVLFGASTPRSESSTKTIADLVCPVDFRCPISLDLMSDPVVAATGQTYDRSSISLWIESGHNTCPKTAKIPFEVTDANFKLNGGVSSNKAALEATRMTAIFLVGKLSTPSSNETASRIVYELRLLAKTDSDNRACIGDAGAIPLLVRYLNDVDPNLQVNAVTTLLNLSILEANKNKIMETIGAVDGIVEALRSGATWEVKENAAATIFSLSTIDAHRKKLGRKTRVIRGLVGLAKVGPTSAKKDALLAILNLAVEREAIGRLIEAGVVHMAVEMVDELPEEAVAILAAIAKRGGAAQVATSFACVRKMAIILRDGPESARESAAAGLVSVCHRGGEEVVGELAGTPGIERAIWELMGMGTGRGRRKSASLLRILRRWAEGMENRTIAFSMNNNVARMALRT
ncbi:hypothetical protein GIB67_041168 [Kingdonia uniflora]|uniref:RING-type E3 ubiquitin transferase n=1 Tax=Kingdonia uniflora TaxID=39325 RepID=A0A7J7LKN6_9MAGN|nr:hypothetical protein GIB67_041168 [Kingdonia uniflora]